MSVRLTERLKLRGKKSASESSVVLPGLCPACEGPGYLEHINLVNDTKTQTCRACHLIWETPISESVRAR